MRRGPTGADRPTLSIATGDYVAARSAGYENQALVRYLLFLYYVSDGLRNDSIHSERLSSNFWSPSKAKQVFLKSCLIHNLEQKKVLTFYLL